MRPAMMDSAMTPVPTVARVRPARGDMRPSVSHSARGPGGPRGSSDGQGAVALASRKKRPVVRTSTDEKPAAARAVFSSSGA